MSVGLYAQADRLHSALHSYWFQDPGGVFSVGRGVSRRSDKHHAISVAAIWHQPMGGCSGGEAPPYPLGPAQWLRRDIENNMTPSPHFSETKQKDEAQATKYLKNSSKHG